MSLAISEANQPIVRDFVTPGFTTNTDHNSSPDDTAPPLGFQPGPNHGRKSEPIYSGWAILYVLLCPLWLDPTVGAINRKCHKISHWFAGKARRIVGVGHELGDDFNRV